MPVPVSREVLHDPRLERALRHRADHLVHELPVPEEQERRDAHHPELLELRLVLVAVDLREHDLARVLPRELVDRRGDCVAGAAPLRPEVNNHVRVLLHDALEVGVRDVDRCVLDHGSCPSGAAHYRGARYKPELRTCEAGSVQRTRPAALSTRSAFTVIILLGPVRPHPTPARCAPRSRGGAKKTPPPPHRPPGSRFPSTTSSASRIPGS